MSTDFSEELAHVLNGEDMLCIHPRLAGKTAPGFQVNASPVNLRGKVAFSVLQGLPRYHHRIVS